jgi:putative hydrolase of the HAD superfamily
MPEITLSQETALFIEDLYGKKVKMGIITDGRSITQRNKLKALGIERYFSDIIISEEFGSGKPNGNNYVFFEDKYPGYSFYYMGDNTSKDFIIPQKLGWRMVCLRDNGNNIHKQSFDGSIKDLALISSFTEILIS